MTSPLTAGTARARRPRGTPVRLTTPSELRLWSERCRAAGLEVGLVPTMGALHAGHLSLVRRALAECDRVAVSIFVNPRQFGPGEDHARYPRPLEDDLRRCADEGVDAVFTPRPDVMFPPSMATAVTIGPPLSTILEGASRPGHFDGVALVVAKLLIAARPDRAYVGQKDAQQCAVIRRLAADLDTGADIVVCPTVRDPDGLACSSRNAYLTPEQRRRAVSIPAALARAARLHAAGVRDPAELRAAAQDVLASAAVAADYVAAVRPSDFTEVTEAALGSQLVVAARIDGTRLIDALTLGVDEPPDVGGGARLQGDTAEMPVSSGMAEE